MNKLIFLHNYVTSTISWIICNENYKLIDKGQTDSLSTLKDKACTVLCSLEARIVELLGMVLTSS